MCGAGIFDQMTMRSYLLPFSAWAWSLAKTAENTVFALFQSCSIGGCRKMTPSAPHHLQQEIEHWSYFDRYAAPLLLIVVGLFCAYMVLGSLLFLGVVTL